ncbi:MAG: flagellar hook-associated protein FlgK [Candidatus Rokubacteria bacterium]|nr:flagellar hook-associated protein FlgK [Candidatus Rokubacteria bacterium]
MAGLFGLLGIGARSLAAAQLAQATVGNNAANAATPGFSRRRVSLVEAPALRMPNGIFGTGVLADEVTRLRNLLIDAQWRADSQTLAYSRAQSGILAQVESLFGAADQAGLALALNGLFAAFGDVAARPEDFGARQALLGQGQIFANAMTQTQDRLVQLKADAFTAIEARVSEVNDLATQLAALNQQLAASTDDPALADSQDRLVDRLAELIGVRATRRADGSVQVVLEGTGIQLVDGARTATVAVTGAATTGTVSLTVSGITLTTANGEIGGLLAMRNSSTDGLPKVLADLDALAAGVIEAVNRVHASGAGRTLAQSVTGSVTVTDPTAMLNAAGLWVTPQAGSLTLGVFDATGTMVSTSTLAIDPTTTSLNALATALDALPDISASVAGGQLTISATNPANKLAFGTDTSDILVALGLNGFFTGTDAGSIAVSTDLTADPYRVAAAQADFTAGLVSAGDNRNARALQALQSNLFMNGNTQTASDFLGSVGTAVGTWMRAATAQIDTHEALVAAADAQRQAESGVNLDEELADMVRYQHAYEASARYIQTVNEMIKSLLEII